MALRSYFPVAKVQSADPRDSCREDADKPKIPSTYVVRPLIGQEREFVAVSSAQTEREIASILADAGTVG